ncbi:uncharacterized protein N7511_003894 [Penicillium nucicola]|uniref:uncharacterized protein n=1 Tax=Penicillium nucicola TaxID=1850975 RepID=UPI002544DD14|nr:uncharacterized protein N7511_003894 [Penicillium nucicola]KAJ5766278.1 hypothetical protein N7511_003894 [Penicillium nucicola]
MHFLCLHGAIGNTDNITIQLAPLQKDLGEDATFHYINGPLSFIPPPGFEEYFGVGPHYRWADDGQAPEDSWIMRIRGNAAPSDDTNNEDAMRGLLGEGSCKNHPELMKYIYDALERNPEIGGIIAYSEGAMAASTFILDEARREQEEGRERRIKCAMFVGGWPAMKPNAGFILADDGGDEMIDIPTLHVVGANDPFRYGSEALYDICDPDTAEYFDMGKGHVIPRSGLVIGELSNALRELVKKTEPEE